MKCPRCGTDHDLPSKEWPLSGLLCSWRAERPDEWIMDEFLSKSLDLEKRCEEAERERDELKEENETLRCHAHDAELAFERNAELKAENATLKKALEAMELKEGR